MNRRILVAVAFVCGAALGAGASEVSDTLVFEQVDKVRIETRDTVQRIVISGQKDDPEMHYVQRISIPDTTAVRRQMRNVRDFNKIVITRRDDKPSKWSGSIHLNFGLTTLPGIPDGDVVRGIGFEAGIGLTADYNPFGKKNQWSVGLGFGYRHFEAPKNRYWTRQSGVMTLVPFDDAQTDRNASMYVSSIELPLLYTHRFDDRGRWAFSLGVIGRYNMGGTDRRYELAGEVYHVDGGLSVRPFSVDGLAVLKLRYLPAFYVRYSPMSFFRDDRGPKFRQLTFGVCF